MEEMDELYGKTGIDTPYEREQVMYRPQVVMPDRERIAMVNPNTIIKIERAKDFTIAQSLIDYDALSKAIEAIMQTIEGRQATADFKAYKGDLAAGDSAKIIAWEDKYSDHHGAPDYEVYTILFHMKKSVDSRRSFIDTHYRNQITDERNVEDLLNAEHSSIAGWTQMELKFLEIEEKIQQLYQEHGDDESVDENDIQRQVAALEEELASQDAAKRDKSEFHTTLADASYIHRNRYLMFMQVTEKAKQLIEQPQLVLGDGTHDMIMQISTLTDRSGAQSHLILAFRDLKTKHTQLKGQYQSINDQKEQFVSKQLWFYQQLKVKSGQGLQDWLYNQNENSTDTFQKLATLLVDSMKTTGDKYQSGNADILRFYQQESVFYDDQMGLIQKKEEIRRFLKIIEDLEDVSVVTEEWAQDYLKAQGYAI
ncbi:hypothetical protein GZH47_32800 (plasmid) [Paenibacillus rhizovicinus]|uniref:Uncharacterized protein n=1 Tax=Paenibacillus rhizovicinus TaxID=2704463 RepID=A0A6C0PB16_9BACL|nr:hypothetical protein [Paenibacillus rhizovicinus]QHW35679.1 hypothetical protein GZH47_32800 [Paenibacillus rhizovicinus]